MLCVYKTYFEEEAQLKEMNDLSEIADNSCW